MSNMLNNPNIKKSNGFERKESLKPKNSFNVNDLKLNQNNEQKKKKEVSQVTFKTSVKMDNHTKNVFQAMSILGMAKNQSQAIKVVQDAWRETITESERKTLDAMVQTLESRDVRNNN